MGTNNEEPKTFYFFLTQLFVPHFAHNCDANHYMRLMLIATACRSPKHAAAAGSSFAAPID